MARQLGNPPSPEYFGNAFRRSAEMGGWVSQRLKSLRFSMQIIAGKRERKKKIGMVLILVWCCCLLILFWGLLHQAVKGEIGTGRERVTARARSSFCVL